MNNKKLIAKGLIFGTIISNSLIDSMANNNQNLLEINDSLSLLNKDKIKKENKVEDSIKELKTRNIIKTENNIIVNKNIRTGTVLEIRLSDSNQFVEDLSGNPGQHETVKVITEGDKKLVKTDYDNLRLSGIPKVDLSEAWSDSIPESAFLNATHLTEFKFPQGITSIEQYAFRACNSLTGDLIIPEGVTFIGNSSFEMCNSFNGELVIPDSVETIDYAVFRGCYGLTGNLNIPDSVTYIGPSAFNNCSNLTGDLVIPESITYIEESAFYGCKGFTGSLILPETITSIGSSAFSGCSFTGELIVPNSLKVIASYALYNCGNFDKILISINESHKDANYRQSIINESNFSSAKTYIEIPYDLDISNTWLETTNYKVLKPVVSTYAGNFENNQGIGVSLKPKGASPVKTINILKDEVVYNIEESENGEYIFNEDGNYKVYIKTELGTISNIEFKNISPVNTPGINVLGDKLTIINNGVLSDDYILENFDDSTNLNYTFSNSNWVIENGMLKSERITDNSQTVNEIKVNADKGDKLKLSVKTSSESSYDWGYIYLNGTQVYKETGESVGFEELEFDLLEGENTIKFVYEKDSSGSEGDDAMFIDYIKVIKNETIIIDCDILEYRINGGEWQVYTDSFELDYPDISKILIEARAKHDGFISSTVTQEVNLESDYNEIEEAVQKAEDSRNPADIEDARDLVNQMPESDKKEELQDKLNAIIPNLTLNRENATANLDVYIKSENMLKLSLDTNIITFEDFSGVDDMKRENAINLTVNSSLPYKLNAYLATDIKGSEGNNIMDKEILNIKANSESTYNTFVDTTTPIVLLDDQPADNDVHHGIDLMLKGNLAHEKDIYKTTIKFEAEQK